jgi:hypothetical protein
LSQVGGQATRRGDPALAEVLARAATPPPGSDERQLTHGFHAWPARMHPHTARTLIAASAPGAIADPFMGGGTVPVEALLAGRPSAGSDLNPVALEVAWTRTRRWRGDALRVAARAAADRARALRQEHGGRAPRGFFAAEGAWYDPPALVDVWSFAEALRGGGDTQRALRACLSSVLVKASRQASDSVTRVDRDHRWVPKGRVEQWFLARADELADALAALADAADPATPPPRLAVRDARAPLDPALAPYAAVITSPPYPGTYDYVEHHRRRYTALRLDPAAAAAGEIGSRREQRERGWQSATDRFERDLSAALAAWRPSLAAGGRVLLVIGDGQRPDGVVRSLRVVERAGERAGYVVAASISQPRATQGHIGTDRADAKEEHLVALELPA